MLQLRNNHENESTELPVLLDCDPGLDDMVAMAFLAKEKIVAVASSYGCCDCETTTRNAASTLGLLGLLDIPVIQGCSVPLFPHQRERNGLPTFFGGNGLNNVDLPQCPALPICANSLDELAGILSTHIASVPSLDYLVTGPCSNLALLIRRYPETVRRHVRRVIIMGGALSSGGNIGAVEKATGVGCAEFNVYLDPAAFLEVISFGIPVELVTWDQAKRFKVTQSTVNHMHPSTRYGEYLVRIMRAFFKLYGDDTWSRNDSLDRARAEPSLILSDPLVVLARRGQGRFSPVKISVDVDGDFYGRTHLSDSGFWVNLFEISDPDLEIRNMFKELGFAGI